EPKAITVTAEAKTKVYGTADPALTYLVTGLVGNDKITSDPRRDAGENAGTYPIKQGDLTAGPNYVITFVPADFNIT
ncbi:MBG domain-containing protein, partial [Hufsiella ginkgonis]